MNALIINPWITDFKLYDEWMHPVGLYFLISLLEQNGFTVYFFNCTTPLPETQPKTNGTGSFPSTEIKKPEIYRNLHRRYKRYGVAQEIFETYLHSIPEPNIVLVGSSMTYWIEGLASTLEIVQHFFPAVPLVIGGISAQLIPAYLQSRFSCATIYQGSLFDDTFIALVSNLLLKDITNTATKPASIIPAFKNIGHFRHGPILTSLGCPLNCFYCASKTLQPQYYCRHIKTITDEIETLYTQFNVTHFAFYDDALLYKANDSFLLLLKELKERKIHIHLHLPNGLHVQWITPQLLNSMKESGFDTLRFGYESGNIKYRNAINNKTSQQELAAKVVMMKDAGFAARAIGVYVMGGLPNQSPQDMLDDVDFVSSLGIMVKPVFLSPVPTTQLFEEYATDFPQLRHNPLWHNDSFFVMQLPLWNMELLQNVVDRAKLMNLKL